MFWIKHCVICVGARWQFEREVAFFKEFNASLSYIVTEQKPLYVSYLSRNDPESKKQGKT